MRLPHEKPDHIEEYLVTVRTGAWFSWSDINNKIYANLVVNDGGSKPTEKECIDGLASLQAEWDKNNADYVNESLHLFLDIFNIFVRVLGLSR